MLKKVRCFNSKWTRFVLLSLQRHVSAIINQEDHATDSRCDNCKGVGHTRANCPSEGGGKYVPYTPKVGGKGARAIMDQPRQGKAAKAQAKELRQLRQRASPRQMVSKQIF